MQKNKFIIIISCFLFLLISCNKSLFRNVDLESNDLMMFFYISNPDIMKINDCDFLNDFGLFYIDEPSIIKEIQSEIVKAENNDPFSSCFYLLNIIQDGNIKSGGFLDANNGLIYTGKMYEIDLDKLAYWRSHFKKLDAYEVNTFSFSATKKILPELEKNGAFIYGYSWFKVRPYEKFNGRMKLSTDSLTIALGQNNEKFKKKLAKSICSSEKIMLGNFSCNSGDSSIIEIYCKEDIASEISSEYTIIESYTDSVNLPFLVYNLDSISIKNLFQENNIKKAKIENINK